MEDQQQQTSSQLQERVQTLAQEKMQLHEQSEQLFIKVGYLEGRLAHLASSNTDLSCRLVHTEEERLKICKELIEEKLQINKIREQHEQETFELKNKILSRDAVITDLESDRDRLLRELQSAQVSLRSDRDLRGELATLKNQYQVLAESHGRERDQNQELSAELLALAQAQDALRRQLEEQQQSTKRATRGLHGELDRVQALISRMDQNRVKPEDLATLDKEQKTLEKTLLGNQDQMRATLQEMRSGYEEQHKKLEEKVALMGKEQQESHTAFHVSQQELSKQRAALVCSQRQVNELEEGNSKLQLQVKELNEEYRARLVCYLQDLSSYIGSLGDTKRPTEHSQLRAFVDGMLQDVRASYRVREEQLASAARSYKKRLQSITRTHHALIIAYRVQREQIFSKPDAGLDPGPPEAQFSPEPTELREELEKEVQRLRQDKARLEAELQAAREQKAGSEAPTASCQVPGKLGQIGEESWRDVKKQLKETTDTVEPERERLRLLTRATVAESQVLELQDFINNHLGRYKQEISRLRRLQEGGEEMRCSQTAHSSENYQ